MSRHILLLLLGLVAVQAMFRPIYSGGGGHDDDDCDESSEESSPSPSVSTTTRKYSYICPEKWKQFKRTPSANDTGIWCMRFIPSNTSITINNASKLCKDVNGELTAFENDAERAFILAEAKAHIIDTLKKLSGAIALSGKRIEECSTTNKTVLAAPPCNNAEKVFTLPESDKTNATFLWKNWASDEPSSTDWGSEVEDCLQMLIEPLTSGHNGKINDFFCNYKSSPRDSEYTLYMNFGALCGQSPEIESID